MTVFQYDWEIMTRFPETIGGVIIGSNITNTATSSELRDLYQAEQQVVIEGIGAGATPLSAIPSLSAWRRVLRSFGVDATKYRSAPEALLRRLTKKGDIPCINTLVDIGNLISIRYALPVAVFDLQKVRGAITVHFADGSERYQQLGDAEVIYPEVGEVVFSDDINMVIARRWCWRQSQTSAATESSEDIVITIEAQHEDGGADVTNALKDILDLLGQFTNGEYQQSILHSNKLSIS